MHQCLGLEGGTVFLACGFPTPVNRNVGVHFLWGSSQGGNDHQLCHNGLAVGHLREAPTDPCINCRILPLSVRSLGSLQWRHRTRCSTSKECSARESFRILLHHSPRSRSGLWWVKQADPLWNSKGVGAELPPSP
ncbi:hypothetical protein GOODEAATRI_011151 [Goodea atripinnis]|uniref:Uncharacterized protein n=1 Tax=Goodea atripinnis TaxID=208336 RepID=A0ABV0MH36_9TELE